MNLILTKEIDGKIYNLYDLDALTHYNSGEFNRNYKTDLSDKIKLINKMDLPCNVVESFLNSIYSTVLTTKEFFLYRIYGEYMRKDGTISGAKLSGAFATTEFAESTIDAKLRLALDPKWLNSRMYESKILIPIGTVLNVGIVAPIHTLSGTTLEGGADQILLPRNWPQSWIVGYRRINTSQLHRIPEFSPVDPSIQNDKATLYPHICPICHSINSVKLNISDRIHFVGSKGGKYTTQFKCLDCSTYW